VWGIAPYIPRESGARRHDFFAELQLARIGRARLSALQQSDDGPASSRTKCAARVRCPNGDTFVFENPEQASGDACTEAPEPVRRARVPIRGIP